MKLMLKEQNYEYKKEKYKKDQSGKNKKPNNGKI